MKKNIFLIVMFSVFFIGSGVNLSAADETISFGVLPLEHPETMFERFNPFIEYLERETGLDFKLRLYPTRGKRGGYTAAVKGLLYGDTPFAFLAPVTLSQARFHDPKVEPLVCAQRAGSPTYIGHIAVRNDSDIRTVEDLRGRRVVGSSVSSTSGNLMPSAMLVEKGMDKSEFAAMNFAGAHDKAAFAVLAGSYDACWINDRTFQAFKDRGIGLRSIWSHPPVPEFPISVNTRFVEPEIIKKVKEALLKMHLEDLPALKAIDKKYEKWLPVTWADYQPIMDAIDRVHGVKFYELED